MTAAAGMNAILGIIGIGTNLPDFLSRPQERDVMRVLNLCLSAFFSMCGSKNVIVNRKQEIIATLTLCMVSFADLGFKLLN